MHVERNTAQRGFTLVELVMVLMVFGIIMSGLMLFYSSYMHQVQIEKSERAIKYSREAIKAFKVGNGKYPCPARAGLDTTDPNYGVADCTIAPVAGVLIGVVPNNIAEFSGIRDFVQNGFNDAWLRRINYAVTRDLSQASGAPFNTTAGVISVVDEFNQDTGGIEDDAHFVVWSMGGDVACPAGTGDAENCNGDVTFRDSLRYDANTPLKYNDFISYYNQAELTIWSSHSPGGVPAGDAKNDNTNNIGLGVTTPTERMDIAGNISLTSSAISYSNMVCKDGAARCMRPEKLYNISCRSGTPSQDGAPGVGDPRQYLKGVTIGANGEVIRDCQYAQFPGAFIRYYTYPGGVEIVGGCPSGVRYITTNGNVFCY